MAGFGPLGGRRTIGRLRHRVTIQSPSADANAYGERMPQTWADVATAWARVEPFNGNSPFLGGQVQPVATHKVTLRRREDVTTKDRVLWLDVKDADGSPLALNVVAVLPGQGEENVVELVCMRQG